MEDREIVSLFWMRNEDALEETAKKYGNYCYSIAYRILANHEDSEESVNDTYIDAWNSIPPHRPSVLSAFLGKITRRIAIDRWRNGRAEKRGGGEALLVLDELQECIATENDIEKIIYTLIYAGISMIALDRMHIQNINSEVIIISQKNNAEIQEALMKEMRRGVSYWDGYGAYTGEGRRVIYIVVSKYELPNLHKIVARIDPKAFISVKNGVVITGNFEKRL